MRRTKSKLEPRDAPVLALTHAFIDSYGPLSDDRLVELLGAREVEASAARKSLLRLERAGHLAFGASGWHVPREAPAVLYAPVSHAW